MYSVFPNNSFSKSLDKFFNVCYSIIAKEIYMRFTLRNLKQKNDNTGIPTRLIILACINLYTEDSGIDSILYSFNSHKYKGTAYLNECLGKRAPDNMFQQALKNIAPKARKLRLHIKMWGSPIPSHYIVIHRNPETDLFELSSNRIIEFPASYKTFRDGICVTWPNHNPDVACGQQFILTRIVGGGVGVTTVIAELESIPEVQRELSLAVDTAKLFTNKDEFSVWTNPGKFVCKIAKPSDSSWVKPHTFEIIRTRPYTHNVSKPVCILWANPDADLAFSPHPRYILPQIKNATQFRPDSPELDNFLFYTLDARLLPFVAVAKENRATIYTLSYSSQLKNAFSVVIGNRLASKCSHIPMVTLVDLPPEEVTNIRKYRLAPNITMTQFIYSEYFHGNLGDDKAHADRQSALISIMKLMGYTFKEHLPIAFKNWGIQLTDQELGQLELG